MQAPYRQGDNTRDWIEQYRENGKVRPALVTRIATDTNYVYTVRRELYSGAKQLTKSMMNLGLPGMRVPGALTWSVTESLDTPVQQATLEMANALYVSTTETTLSSFLPAEAHSPIIMHQWVGDSLGAVQMVQGNTGSLTGYYPGDDATGLHGTTFTNKDPSTLTDADGYHYREDEVKYRMFAPTAFWVADATGFPDPAIPQDDDNDIPDSTWWQNTSTGIGAYFVRIGSEVVRVHYKDSTGGRRFWIAPGGRGIASNITPHYPGEPVTLLGIGSRSGDWTGMGYLNVSDTEPQKCLMRPGTCITSYEGYGNITGALSHEPSNSRNYQFTGYWFIAGVEPSIAADGVPRIKLDLRSSGYMLEAQKITPDLLRRAKSQWGQWTARGSEIWGDNDHSRTIPNSYIDQSSWDPSSPNSYPLAIKTELAQHKEFLEHMQNSNLGRDCEICREELREWQRAKPPGATPTDEDRAVGKHIYTASMRVMREEAGPLKTYIRTMAMLAMAAWDHPAFGTELAQSFTKIPNKLFTNMYNLNTGLVFNGQLDFTTQRAIADAEWVNPTYSDENIIFTTKSLTCPFEATYDKAPFYQPMVDLAEINGNIFWISRKGEPIFKPRTFSMRPFNTNPEWFQKFGGSIDAFSSNIDASSIVTQVWVTASSAFDSNITVRAAGTGVDNSGNVRVYSQYGGNSQGLSLTSGVQQVDTMSLDNLVLGLSWDTNPAQYGMVQEIDDHGQTVVNARPPTYVPGVDISAANAAKYPKWVIDIQRTLNFFVYRRYIFVPSFTEIQVTGTWGKDTTEAVKAIRVLMGLSAGTGIYTKALAVLIRSFLDTNKNYIKFDIWWYAFNKRPWEEYLSAITGVPIQLKSTDTSSDADGSSVAAIIQNSATQKAVGDWTATYSKDLVNIGNKYVDDTINKAVARTISSNLADPRLMCGDIVWADVPGFLTFSNQRPFNNGIYLTSINRSMDLNAGTFTATYTGYRFIGAFSQGLGTSRTGFGFLDG